MPALPADIAKYTTDGVVVTASNPAIKTSFSDAQDGGEVEIEMFYDTEADAQWALNERFAIVSQIAPPHMALEIAETIALGTDIPIAPQAPCLRVIDAESGIDDTLRVISYAYEMNSDRYSIEVMK